MTLQMIEPRLLMGLSLAASIIAHLALTLGLLFAEAHPFEDRPPEAITVDIVAPEQARPLPEPAEPPKPAEPKQPDQVDPSLLTAPVKPTTSSAPAAQQAAQKSQAAATAASQPPAASGSQQAAAKAQGTEALQPAPPTQSSSQPPQPPPGPPAPAPDITVKYGVMLGLPAADQYAGFDARAYDTAKISTDDVAAFRRHLKTCSVLPAAVAPTDKVRIVLRVLLSRDGMLVAEPALLEASASAKGPLLMQKAISALQACQPYSMLPLDKYKEWKMLDLPFTPQDFTSG
jgi:hypothetical protein